VENRQSKENVALQAGGEQVGDNWGAGITSFGGRGTGHFGGCAWDTLFQGTQLLAMGPMMSEGKRGEPICLGGEELEKFPGEVGLEEENEAHRKDSHQRGHGRGTLIPGKNAKKSQNFYFPMEQKR